jgi:hypothetical protein
MVATPVLATPPQQPQPQPAQVQAVGAPVKKPASAEELDQYAARERTAEKLAKFEGGRGGNDTLITVILVLVIVILVLAIIH